MNRPRLRRTLLATSCLVGLTVGTVASAAAAEVRAWDHGDHGRLVFDWGEPVHYALTRDGRRLEIGFERRVDADLAAATQRLSRYLRSVSLSPNRRRVVIETRETVAVEDRGQHGVVVLELRSDTPAAPLASVAAPPPRPASIGPSVARPAAAKAAAPIRVRGGEHDTYSRIVFDWPETVPYSLDYAGNTVTVRFEAAARADLAPARRAGLRYVEEISQFGDDALAVAVIVPAETRVRHFYSGTKVVIDLLDAAAAGGEGLGPRPLGRNPAPSRPSAPPTAAQMTAPDAAAARDRRERTQPAPDGSADGAARAADPAAPEGPTPAAVFDPGVPAAAAIFNRAGGLWVVLAADAPLDAAPLAVAGADVFGLAEVVPTEAGVAALRYSVGTSAQPQVRRDGTAWVVTAPDLAEADEATAEAGTPLMVESQPESPFGPRLLVPADGARYRIHVVDPGVGDSLVVVPLPESGRGLPAGRQFVRVALLPTGQGLVGLAGEGVVIRPTEAGVEITAPEEGLSLSSPSDVAAAAGRTDGPQPRLLLAEWRRAPKGFVEERRALQQALVSGPAEDLDRARLALARFYLGHGYAEEALGQLDLMAGHDPAIEGHPDFRLLRGAARGLAGNLEGAAADLEAVGLAAAPEAALWRGAVAAERGDWAAAARDFEAAGDLPEHYQISPFQERFAQWMAEAALRLGDLHAAQDRLSWLAGETDGASERTPGVAYLRGEIAWAAGNDEVATVAWERAIDSDDRLHATLSKMALTDMQVALGELSPGKAAERLEALRYAWRGDDLEFRLLERLGDVHWTGGSHRQALETWQRAVSGFPDLPDAEALRERSAARFAELFTTDLARSLSPLEAVSLYEDFKELMPEGAGGDRILEGLAERLVEIDLLDRAAQFLEQLVDERLEGSEKARVATRLAGIRLLDGRPREAIAALDATTGLAHDAALAAERRLLRARALSELDRPEAAFAQLEDDRSPLAEAARLDIAWRAGDFERAAESLRASVGDPPPLGQPIPAEQSKAVVDLALALAMTEDRQALDRLAVAFGPAMEDSAEADTFRLLTRRAGGPAAVADLAAVRRDMAEVALFEDFLAGYRSGAAR